MIINAVLWFLIGVITMGITWGAYSYYQPDPVVVEKQCFNGHVTVEGPYKQRWIVGDIEVCGSDIEIGSVTGPSELYDPGDPL